MPLRLPLFLRRALLLREARIALTSDQAARALEILRDPRLAVSYRARSLRGMALDCLCREAGELAQRGDVLAAERCTQIVSMEDPARGAALHRHLTVKPAAIANDGREESASSMLRSLLAQLRTSLAGTQTATGVVAGSVRLEHPMPTASRRPEGSAGQVDRVGSRMTGMPPAPDARAEAARAVRFHMAVDDGGEFLVVCGSRLTIGHLRSPRSDLPFLADVESDHAVLSRDESFHAGAIWRLERRAARAVKVNGRVLETDVADLADGDVVELAQNLAFRFRAPEPSSSSAVLELAAGAECLGAVRILLLSSGSSGRVRIGPRRIRHIPVADLLEEVSIELQERTLCVRCPGGVRLGDLASPPGPEAALCVPCPPDRALTFRLGARGPDRPPFSITLRPPPLPPL